MFLKYIELTSGYRSLTLCDLKTYRSTIQYTCTKMREQTKCNKPNFPCSQWSSWPLTLNCDMKNLSIKRYLIKLNKVWKNLGWDLAHFHIWIDPFTNFKNTILKSYNSLVARAHSVESLDFMVAQFSWNSWVPLFHLLTSSMN